jgi:hypothetical protein
MRTLARYAVLCLLLLPVTASLLRAQTFRGTLRGTVADTTGQ